MRIISTCEMGYGTFEAKFIPLSLIDEIEKIYVVRGSTGPEINKVEYLIIPNLITKFNFFKVIIPFILAYYSAKYKCDLIIGYHIIPHAFYARIASIITGIPYACAQTGLDIQKFSSKFLFKSLLRSVLSKSLFFNVPGQSSKRFWINFGIDGKKINELHSTIDINRFKKTNTEKEYDFIILSRLSKEKRIEKLVHIFSLLNKENFTFKVAIVGDGPQKNVIQALIEKYNLEEYIFLLGFVKEPELWLNKAKCYLLSSESEGFPTALMQAMACELITISTNVGNISDTIINAENGFIVDYGDWDKYKNIMENVLNDEINYTIKVKARDSIIQNHSFSSSIKLWENVLINNHLINK